MPYQAKPLSLDPKSITASRKRCSSATIKKLCRAVNRLNAIETQLKELDSQSADFVINGLKPRNSSPATR